ncbi:MAG: hypothetical protein LBU41_05865 [Clostridiales Family XIII bacterium]|jgi:hypothetical protein|nr:hypothetical protein [Clostridiales Family XIII bacterium]
MHDEKKEKLRGMLITIVFLFVLGGFFILNRLISPPEILTDERRPAEKFPKITAESVAKTKFMDDFELWAADNFAFRKAFRTLHTETTFHVFFQTDKNGLYLGNSGAGKFEKIKEEEWKQSLRKIKKVEQNLTEWGIENIRFAFIPDKSIFAGRYFPGFDLEEARQIVETEFSDPETNIEIIDIANTLNASDFYRTDLHWDQSQILDVAQQLLGTSYKLNMEHSTSETGSPSPQTAGDFTGVYPGQLALNMKPDTLRYIPANNIRVSYLDVHTQEMTTGVLYKEKALTEDMDAYDFFLSGSQPLIFLENTQTTSDRTLYFFRDSFGSSIAPLLAASGSYKKIVCIDLRYIDLRMISQVITLTENADALFLYSSQILNNPTVLLVG